MPPLTRWFLKSALVYLVLALLLGIALATPQAPRHVASALGPVYVHLFMVGWVTQMIFGVAHWMFPRQSKERPRGREMLVGLTYITLNLGLIARAFAEPMQALRPAAFWTAMLVTGAGLQWLGGLTFALNIWNRVKER